jgi:hypothetical protein
MHRSQMSLLFGGVAAVAIGVVGSGTKPIPASVYSAMTEPANPRAPVGPSGGDAEMTTPKLDPTKVAALEPAPSAAPAAPESPATPARTAEAPPSVPVAAPSPTAEPAPAAVPAPADSAPADDTKGKPRIRLDSERGEVSLDTDKGGISLGKERVSLRTPFGKIDFDW